MIVLHRYKLLYIHIPKCAGSSVTAALLPIAKFRARKPVVVGKKGWQTAPHLKLSLHDGAQTSVGAVILRQFPEYKVFTVVRNPWDRFRSLADSKGLGNGNLWDLERALGGGRKRRRHLWAGEQVGWLPEGREVVCLRFERLASDWAHFVEAEKLPIPSEIGHENRRIEEHVPYQELYGGDEELIEAVGKRYARDVEAWGYKFFPEKGVDTGPAHR